MGIQVEPAVKGSTVDHKALVLCRYRVQNIEMMDVPLAVVVDDNPVILLHASDVLHDAGFSVFSAADANEAVQLLELHADGIDLLVTNVMIPGFCDGLSLARTYGTRHEAMAIVVMSGQVVPRSGDLPPRAVFLEKPFTDAELLTGVAAARRQAACVEDPVR